MCKLLSGHIVFDKDSKEWGKIYLVTGIHHEEDKVVLDRKGIDLHILLEFEYDFNDRQVSLVDRGQGLSRKDITILKEIVKKDIKREFKKFVRNTNYDEWALEYCKTVKNDKKIANKIVSDKYLFLYCRDVEDNKEMANKIKSDEYLYDYCLYVENDKKIANKIVSDKYLFLYCRDVEDNKEMANKIKSDEYLFCYCDEVEYDKKIGNKITQPL